MIFSVIYLSKQFIADYPQSHYRGLMLKDKRPYGCLLIKTHNDYYICVPFRSHIHHKNAFLFKNTERSKTDSSGLDYSKTVLIRPEDYDKYLIENAVVDTDEYKAVRMNIYKIEKQISKYIEGYVKSVSDFENADKKSFERKYKYSTLKYFHDILGIE